MKEGLSNFDRLQQNKQETQKNVQDYILANPIQNSSQQLNSQEVVKFVESFLVQGVSNYSHIIMHLEKVRDLEHGITRTIVTHQDGTSDLIRDARKALNQPNIDSNTSHLISALNIARSSERIIDFAAGNTSSPDKDIVKEKLRAVLENYKNGEKIDNKDFNTEIIKILKQAGIKGNLPKMLAETAEYLSLADPQYHVSTISTAKDKDNKERIIVESDNMLLGLTPELKVQYKEIQRIGANLSEIDKLGVRYNWYKKMSPLQQQLVRDSVNKIIDGCVIPTQLRKSIPGIRNAHAKTTYGTEAEKTSLIKIQETLHTGTLSFHGKGNAQAITDMNVAQLQSFLPKGSVLNVNVLNSPLNPTGIDKSIDRQVGAAQMKNGGLKSTTPFNFFRLFSRNDNSGFEEIIRQLAQKLRTEHLNNKGDEVLYKVGTYLTTGKNEKEVRAALKNSSLDQETKLALEHAVNAKKLLISSHFLYDPQNSNVALTSEMKRLEFEMKKDTFKKLLGGEISKVITSTMCASGKDRTGVAETETTRKAISDFVGCEKVENFEKQISGQHTQVMASLNGGSKGAHGIKKESANSLPKKPYGQVVGLYQKSSSLNNVKYDKFEIRLAEVKSVINKIFGDKKETQEVTPSVKNTASQEVSTPKHNDKTPPQASASLPETPGFHAKKETERRRSTPPTSIGGPG